VATRGKALQLVDSLPQHHNRSSRLSQGSASLERFFLRLRVFLGTFCVSRINSSKKPRLQIYGDHFFLILFPR